MCFIQNLSNETITNNNFVSNHTFLYLYLYVTWQYALLCNRATDAIEQHFGVSPDGNCAYVLEVFLRPTLVQSDEPFDLHGSLSLTTRHRCTHVLVYTARGVCQAVTHPNMDRGRRCLTSVIESAPMN